MLYEVITVEAALEPASRTLGVAVRMTALNELTEAPTLLAQQSEAERQLFARMRYQIEYLLREADFLVITSYSIHYTKLYE